jgi:hypothetical protein
VQRIIYARDLVKAKNSNSQFRVSVDSSGHKHSVQNQNTGSPLRASDQNHYIELMSEINEQESLAELDNVE